MTRKSTPQHSDREDGPRLRALPAGGGGKEPRSLFRRKASAK